MSAFADGSLRAAEDAERFDRELIAEAAALGLTGLLDRIQPLGSRIRLARRLSRIHPGFVYSLPGPGMAGPVIDALGTEKQKKALALDRLSGEFGALAAFERTDATASDLQTRARPTKGGVLLTGVKAEVLNGVRAKWVVVLAALEPLNGPDAHRAFVVHAENSGLITRLVQNSSSLRGVEVAEIRLKNCFVPQSACLGSTETSLAALRRDRGRQAIVLVTAAVSLGVAERALSMITDETKMDPGSIAHCFAPRIGRAMRAFQTSVCVLDDAAERLQTTDSAPIHASLAKLSASAATARIVDVLDEGLRSSVGFRSKTRARIIRDAAACARLGGADHVHALIVAARMRDARRIRAERE